MIKAELFLATTTGRGDAARGLAACTAAMSQLVGDDVAVRAVMHDPSALADLSHGDETEAAAGFCGVVELTASSEERLLEALAAIRPVVVGQTWLDRERSSVVVGTEHVVVAGDQPLMLAMALTRREAMTREEFQEYWATTHAELGRQVPGSQGYRQVHTAAMLTERARSAAGVGDTDFDGVALAYYSDPAALRGILANPSIVEPLLEDERRFIDHERSTFVVGWAPEG